jgi:uncharacterized membrane protein
MRRSRPGDVAECPMKTTHKFKGSWYLTSIVIAVIIGELTASVVSQAYSLRTNPVFIAFLCAGAVSVGAMILFKDAEID